MSLRSRILYRLRAHTSMRGGWPRDRSTGRCADSSASGEREPSASPRSRTRHAHTTAGPAPDPILARYYANLELPYGAGLSTVRRTWRRLVKKYHPDLHSADGGKKRTATELLQGLNRAYDELAKHLERK